MEVRLLICNLVSLAAMGLVSLPLVPACAWAGDQAKPRLKVVTLDSQGYQEILSGPPESVRMKSGYVVLHPKQSVGKHSTGQHEEMLVVLEGHGRMVMAEGNKVDVKANSVLYCPSDTEHDVVNTGDSVLLYVYVVANTK